MATCSHPKVANYLFSVYFKMHTSVLSARMRVHVDEYAKMHCSILALKMVQKLMLKTLHTPKKRHIGSGSYITTFSTFKRAVGYSLLTCTTMHVHCCQIASVSNVCWVCKGLGRLAYKLMLVSASKLACS